MGTKNKEHIGRLKWDHIESLQGFDKQLCALTEVEVAVFCDCHIFCSTLAMHPLKSLGSSLVDLKIHNAETSPTVMEYCLQAFQNFIDWLHMAFRSNPILILWGGPLPHFLTTPVK